MRQAYPRNWTPTASCRRTTMSRILLITLLLLAFLGGARATVTQTAELAQGWNWVSFNVEITLDDLKAALVEVLPGASDISIHSQTQNTTYKRNQWKGQLSTLDLTQMYLIEVPASCEITLEGMPIDPAEHPVTINNGDNWIAFPLSEAMTVTVAFASFAVSGDMVISQTAFAFYTGSRWRGTLTTLEPGKGYIYHSSATESRPFTFPNPNLEARASSPARTMGGKLQSPTQYESHWSDFDYHAYQFNSPLVATIQIDGSTITSDGNWADLEVAAFVDDECRGHAFMADYSEEFGDPYPIVELPVYYNSTKEAVTFKLYDHATGIQYGLCTSNIDIKTGDEHVELYTGSEETVTVSLSATTTSVPVWSAFPTNVSTSLGEVDIELTISDYVSGTPTPFITLSSTTANSYDYDFDENDGYFTFTPSATGTFTFTFTATNFEGSANATLTVTVNPALVTVPTLAVDENHVTDTTAPVFWTACDGVTSYTLQLASDNQFTAGSAGSQVTLISSTTVNGTSYTFTGLMPYTVYYARVKGNDDWSNIEEFITETPAEITLADNATNNASVIKKYDGFVTNVTLQGRALWKDGYWNTLCLPFNLTDAQVAAQLENPTALMTLNGTASSLTNGTLTLNFTDATEISAGKPYIIKWDSGENIENPVFTGVTIDAADRSVTSGDGSVIFKGNYDYKEYTTENTSILFLGTDNTLYWPQPKNGKNPSLGAFRAYFELADGTLAREFKLNFGDSEASGITTTNFTNYSGTWYTLDGRKLQGKPTKPGLYIHNCRKVAINN